MGLKDGETPGVDDDAIELSDQIGEPADKKTGDKSKKGGKTDDDSEGETPKGKFYSDEDLNKIIQNRIARATKDSEAKAKLTETQRLEKERDDALNLVKERDLKDDFVNGLKIDAGKAGRLFKMYRDEINTDDNGKATNMADVVKSVKVEFPEYFKPQRGKGDGAEGGGDKGKTAGGDMNDFIRRATGRGK